MSKTRNPRDKQGFYKHEKIRSSSEWPKSIDYLNLFSYLLKGVLQWNPSSYAPCEGFFGSQFPIDVVVGLNFPLAI